MTLRRATTAASLRHSGADDLATVYAVPHPATRSSQSVALQLAGLLYPSCELGFIKLVVLVDVEVAHVFLLGLAARHRLQRHATEESHLHVVPEDMVAEEPALRFDAVKRRYQWPEEMTFFTRSPL
jgi:hypothetical protein